MSLATAPHFADLVARATAAARRRMPRCSWCGSLPHSARCRACGAPLWVPKRYGPRYGAHETGPSRHRCSELTLEVELAFHAERLLLCCDRRGLVLQEGRRTIRLELSGEAHRC